MKFEYAVDREPGVKGTLRLRIVASGSLSITLRSGSAQAVDVELDDTLAVFSVMGLDFENHSLASGDTVMRLSLASMSGLDARPDTTSCFPLLVSCIPVSANGVVIPILQRTTRLNGEVDMHVHIDSLTSCFVPAVVAQLVWFFSRPATAPSTIITPIVVALPIPQLIEVSIRSIRYLLFLFLALSKLNDDVEVRTL